jgi:predicted nuclease with TOPRIM domain
MAVTPPTPEQLIAEVREMVKDRPNYGPPLIAVQLADALTAALERIKLLEKQARQWNEEADRYLAKRDELTVRIKELEKQLTS